MFCLIKLSFQVKNIKLILIKPEKILVWIKRLITASSILHILKKTYINDIHNLDKENKFNVTVQFIVETG